MVRVEREDPRWRWHYFKGLLGSWPEEVGEAARPMQRRRQAECFRAAGRDRASHGGSPQPPPPQPFESFVWDSTGLHDGDTAARKTTGHACTLTARPLIDVKV
jgi:hypothetical protein